METATLSKEIEFFRLHREQWVHSHLGEYVTIQDDTVAGFYDTYAEALRAGLMRFGVSRGFLVKQVWVPEPVYCVS